MGAIHPSKLKPMSTERPLSGIAHVVSRGAYGESTYMKYQGGKAKTVSEERKKRRGVVRVTPRIGALVPTTRKKTLLG
jgi:hypothetical protein